MPSVVWLLQARVVLQPIVNGSTRRICFQPAYKPHGDPHARCKQGVPSMRAACILDGCCQVFPKSQIVKVEGPDDPKQRVAAGNSRKYLGESAPGAPVAHPTLVVDPPQCKSPGRPLWASVSLVICQDLEAGLKTKRVHLARE